MERRDFLRGLAGAAGLDMVQTTKRGDGDFRLHIHARAWREHAWQQWGNALKPALAIGRIEKDDVETFRCCLEEF